MDNLKFAKIGVYHRDCIASISTEKFPDVLLEQKSPVVVLEKRKGLTKYDILWRASADSEGELEEYLSFLKAHKSSKVFKTLHRQGTQALLMQRIYGPSSSYEAVLRSGAIYAENIPVHAGLEMHSVIASNPDDIGKMLSELDSVGDIKILKAGDYKVEGGAGMLTQKQIAALKIALEHGYYDWPKKARLSDLASFAGISRRSVQERIRRGESKIMREAIEKILGGNKGSFGKEQAKKKTGSEWEQAKKQTGRMSKSD